MIWRDVFSLSTDPLFNLEFVEIALQILTAEDMTEPKYKGVGLGTLSRSALPRALEEK